MSSEYITVVCPNDDCEVDIELECEYEPADPSVGIMSGGPVPCDTPTECSVCKVKYNEEQLARLTKAIKRECDEWQPDEPDFDDYEDRFDDRWDGPAADHAADNHFRKF